MSGPKTVPIRDDRPRGADGRLLDYSTADQDRGDDEGGKNQKKDRADTSRDLRKGSKLRAALITLLPERGRPLANIILGWVWGCTACLLFLALSLIGSVEWHYSPPIWQPRTASAEDLRKLESRLNLVEGDSPIIMRMRISGLQKDLCLRELQSLRLELNELVRKHRIRYGSEPEAMPCPTASNP